MKTKQVLTWLTIVAAMAELVLVLTSWLLSAMMVGGVRSLLSSEGIRWFFGSFADVLATPCLVWILLLAMSGGCLWRSRLMLGPQTFRDKTALRTTVAVLLVYIVIVLLLTVVPHAILLSATGRLLSSPFSRAVIPIVAFGILLVASVYGRMSGHLSSLSAVFDAMSYGVSRCAPLFVLYVVLVQLYASLRFVFL